MSRVKSNSNNSIQVDRVISAKRKVEITLDELRDFLNDNIDKEGVTIGSEGEYIWDDKNNVPKFVTDTISMCKILFDEKEEIKSHIFSVYPNAKSISKTEHIIKRANMNIGSRIIICIGHREVFTLNVSAGGHGGSAPLLCTNNDAFQILMGLASGMDLIYNDLKFAMGPHRNGFRDNKINKDPLKRYIIVIDGLVDTEVLLNEIQKNIGNKSMIEQLTKEDKILTEAPTNKLRYNED